MFEDASRRKIVGNARFRGNLLGPFHTHNAELRKGCHGVGGCSAHCGAFEGCKRAGVPVEALHGKNLAVSHLDANRWEAPERRCGIDPLNAPADRNGAARGHDPEGLDAVPV